MQKNKFDVIVIGSGMSGGWAAKEFAESILPKTNTPGAKEADVASFMNSIVSDFYSTAEQKIFRDGISYVNQLASSRLNNMFVQLSHEDKNTNRVTRSSIQILDETAAPMGRQYI